MHAEVLAQVMGMTQSNVVSMGTVVTQTNIGDAVTTFATSKEVSKFVVGDKISFWDISGDVIVGEETIKSIDVSAKTVTADGTWAVPPEAGDIIIAKVGTVASYSSANKTITLGAGEANRFAAGDRVIFHPVVTDNISALLAKTDRNYIVSVDGGGAILNLNAAFTGTPASPNLLAAYKSIEMLDPLGTINEKSLLVFFDAVVNSVQRQLAIWYPKVTTGGAFAPDFKNNENPMDGQATFTVQSTTQVVNDGTSKVILQLPFFFD